MLYIPHIVSLGKTSVSINFANSRVVKPEKNAFVYPSELPFWDKNQFNNPYDVFNSWPIVDVLRTKCLLLIISLRAFVFPYKSIGSGLSESR